MAEGSARQGRFLRWAGSRPVLVAAILYAVLALGFVSPALFTGRTLSSSDLLWFTTPYTANRPADLTRPSNPELYDEALYLQPWLQYTRDHGLHTPLWNPYQLSGGPLIGTADGVPYAPFYLPLYLLPFWTGLAIAAALKLFIAAFGAFLLARALGQRLAGPLLAGVVYAYGLFFVIWLAWPQTSVWALIPWVLLLTERVVRKPTALNIAGLGGVVGAQFIAGHPESSFHLAVATVLFFAMRMHVVWRGRALDRGLLLPRVGALAGAAVMGAAIGALWLIPFLELVHHSADTGLRAKLAPNLGMEAFGGLFVPAFWGRGTGEVTGVVLTVNRYIYAGALPIVLAGGALVLRRNFQRTALAAFAAVCIAVTLGVPGVIDALRLLPGFHQADNRRLAVWFLLAVALLAGFGLEDLASRDEISNSKRRRLIAIAAGFVAIALVWVYVVHPSPRSFSGSLKAVVRLDTPPLGELLGIAGFAGIGALLVLARVNRRLSGGLFAVLALALVTADLFRGGVGLNPAIPRAHATQPATRAIRYLQSRRPNRFAGVGGGPAPSLGVTTFPYALSLRYGIYDARGYNTPMVGRYQRYWSQEIQPSFYLFTPVLRLTPRTIEGLSLLSVTDIVMRTPISIPPPLHGVHLAYAGRDARIYSNSNALPRAFLVSGEQVMSSEDAALGAVGASDFDPRRFAVTESAHPGLTRAAETSSLPAGTATLVQYDADRVQVRATARRPSLLVLTDVYYPGWKATVDGKPASVDPADYVLRGVAIPAGTHTVTFTYDPSSWKLARVLSLLGVLALIALTTVGVLRLRRR